MKAKVDEHVARKSGMAAAADLRPWHYEGACARAVAVLHRAMSARRHGRSLLSRKSGHVLCQVGLAAPRPPLPQPRARLPQRWETVRGGLHPKCCRCPSSFVFPVGDTVVVVVVVEGEGGLWSRLHVNLHA